MSFMIGICNRWFDYYDITIYDKSCDKYQSRTIRLAESSFEKIILDLKNEFNEKLTKMYVATKDPVLNITNDDPLVHFLSIENVEFTNYLSIKLSSNTKIMHINSTNTTRRSAIRCELYEFVGFSNSISEYKPIKCFYTGIDVEDIYGLLIQIFGCNLREIHAIYYYLNDFSLAKFKTKYEHFCSFTKESPYILDGTKAVIYGRFLLNDKNIQSLVKFQHCLSLSDVRVLKNFDFEAKEHISSCRPVNTYKSQTKLMGIDLGASRIVVSISRNNSAELVKIDQEYSMPSVISFAEEKPIIGSVAMRHLAHESKSVLYDLKYLANRMWPFDRESWAFGQFRTTEKSSFVVKSQGELKQYSTIDIYQILLEKLKTAASEYQSDLNEGELVNQMVITVPDFKNKIMLADICEAANLVGIQIIDIITETQADLLYFLTNNELQHLTSNESVVVIDIGGGTGFIQKFSFDQGFGEKHNLSFLCGREINDWLKKELLIGKYEIMMKDHFEILTKVERIKEMFSFEETAYLNPPSINVKTENPSEMTRICFEQKVMEKIFTFGTNEKIMMYAIEDMNRFPEPSKVFLVGGTCRIPYIQNYFKSIFGDKKIVVLDNLQDVTATGALIHGLQILNGEIDSLFKTKTNEMVLSKISDQSSSKLTNENHFSGNSCEESHIFEENILFAPNNFKSITTTKDYGLQVLNNPSLKMKTNVQSSENKLDKSLNDDFFSENNSVKVSEIKNISQKSDNNEKLLLPPK